MTREGDASRPDAVSPRRPWPWIGTLYFAEGFPYAIVHTLAEVLFKELGASLQAIGLTSLLHLPWNAKLLAGPLLDRYGSKRAWIVGLEAALAAALLTLAATTAGTSSVLAVAIALVAVAILAATHDVAIDGAYIALLDPDAQSRWVGLRVAAYRGALLLVGGPGVVLAARAGFTATFAAASALVLALAVLHARLLPRTEPGRRSTPLPAPRVRGGFYARAFLSFLDRPRAGLVLAFVLGYRAGDSLLEKMRYPFLKDIGMSLEAYGAARTAGLVAALVGPAVGGWLIARHGLRRWIWPFVLAQNGLNLAYAAVAVSPPEGPQAVLVLGAVLAIEMLGSGLGAAVLVVYLVRCASPEHGATHYALLTALMTASLTASGAVSGWLADGLGYPAYFALSFGASIPAMALIPFLPHLEASTESRRPPT